MRFNRGMMAAVLSMGVALMPGLGHAQGIPEAKVSISSKKKKGLFNGAVPPNGEPLIGRRHSGQTVARAKRAAIKSKNRSRNKSAHRG